MPAQGSSRRRASRNKKWLAIAAVTVLAIGTFGLTGYALTRDRGEMTAEEVQAYEENRAAAREAAEAAEAQAVIDAASADEAAQQARIAGLFTAGQTLDIIFAGDSLTNGSYASAAALTFPALIAASISEAGTVDTSITGAAGQTTADALARPVPARGGLLVVEFGTNDVGRGSIEEFTTTYPEYLDALRSESPDAKLACVGTWAPTPKSDLFDAVIQSACAERSGTYVDITDIYMDRATTRAIEGTPWYGGTVKDDAHPNDAGHRAIADAVLAVVG